MLVDWDRAAEHDRPPTILPTDHHENDGYGGLYRALARVENPMRQLHLGWRLWDGAGSNKVGVGRSDVVMEMGTVDHLSPRAFSRSHWLVAVARSKWVRQSHSLESPREALPWPCTLSPDLHRWRTGTVHVKEGEEVPTSFISPCCCSWPKRALRSCFPSTQTTVADFKALK